MSPTENGAAALGKNSSFQLKFGDHQFSLRDVVCLSGVATAAYLVYRRLAAQPSNCPHCLRNDGDGDVKESDFHLPFVPRSVSDFTFWVDTKVLGLKELYLYQERKDQEL